MGDELFDPAALPAPVVLRRRHLALLLIDECLGGGEFPTFQHHGSSAGGELLWFENGSGDEYGLVVDGDEALLWVFDHECPYSPWIRDDEARDWPGMLAGLPDRLAAHLPEPFEGEPRSISGCYWHADGRWSMGEPEPASEPPGAFHSDPQGTGGLIGVLLDGANVSELVVDYHERPELLGAAQALIGLVERGEPVTEDAIAALEPREDAAAAMPARARELGLAG